MHVCFLSLDLKRKTTSMDDTHISKKVKSDGKYNIKCFRVLVPDLSLKYNTFI